MTLKNKSQLILLKKAAEKIEKKDIFPTRECRIKRFKKGVHVEKPKKLELIIEFLIQNGILNLNIKHIPWLINSIDDKRKDTYSVQELRKRSYNFIELLRIKTKIIPERTFFRTSDDVKDFKNVLMFCLFYNIISIKQSSQLSFGKLINELFAQNTSGLSSRNIRESITKMNSYREKKIKSGHIKSVDYNFTFNKEEVKWKMLKKLI
ncbi:hypothetical protein [Reichenbachiella ulvae]|uniref:Uncharacterized protein n=1 Tax=Reichenbachiella ulvae TaxID=2980104 RepID=A0ABT3CZP2_9BACT|nr:hypothetical protein [Reichenbachiella ulvae]MCV9389163.1 hypothetical protein [Reichenbachiella ulvae]